MSHDSVVVIDEKQMECVRGPQKGQCYWLSAIQNARNELRFHAERTMYNDATQENDALGTEVFTATDFSAWWTKRRKNGWRFCE